ncbi:protein APCDD1-like [Penaeus monodon]|uniref:protein APCDD1-like n=1 Tax=Penaeus monodon TaxID=6687 RepID=UPI0018A6EF14|nr:protein APCDD1-like [Penaeus monodon]
MIKHYCEASTQIPSPPTTESPITTFNRISHHRQPQNLPSPPTTESPITIYHKIPSPPTTESPITIYHKIPSPPTTESPIHPPTIQTPTGVENPCTQRLDKRHSRDVPYINVELWALSAGKSFCETRPGPQYVLRAYNFHRDGTFHLALHFYRDPHCAHPAHSLAAHGHLALGRPSWVTPGGTEAEYMLSRVEVVAHTHRDAAMVAAAVNASCPGKVTKPWKPHKAHTVLAYTETGNHVTEDEDCGRGLGGAWHELQLLRVEETSPSKAKKDPSSSSSSLRMRRELFLGDVHTDLSKQDIYRPTGYQQPLLNTKYVSVKLLLLLFFLLVFRFVIVLRFTDVAASPIQTSLVIHS